MKKIAIFCVCLLALATAALAAVYDESNFSSLGRLFQPAPDGYVVGKDNAPGRGTHHPSENCGNCHREGGRAEAYIFTMAGTLYRDRAAREVAKGGEVILEDRAGNVISMTSNIAGNFWTYASVASDPYTVGTTHGHEPFVPLYLLDSEGNLAQPADPSDPRTWKYKTWARKGLAVRPMVSVAGVGGGTAMTTRMSCNMHHGGISAARGALYVSKDPTLASYPASGLSYRKHIYPILRTNCAPCHVPGSTVTSKNTKTDHDTPSTAVDYSSGLDLMFYEGSTVKVSVYGANGAVEKYVGLTKAGVASVVDTTDPDRSSLLLKTLPGGLHGGGTFWTDRSPDYRALRQWIAEGAKQN